MSASDGGVIRQWVSLPGGSCDVRVGTGALESMGSILKAAVGRPQLCAFGSSEGTPPELVERVRRQLIDAQFEVRHVALPPDALARTPEGVALVAEGLARAGITSDDLVCALGGVDALSAASFVAQSWCSGTPLVQVPTDLLCCVQAATTPLGIDVAGSAQMLVARTGAKYQIADLEVLRPTFDGEPALLARALMVTAAACDAEAAVQRLWDRAESLMAGDLVAMRDQIGDTSKSRGHVASSTSVAVRQSLGFGMPFMRAASKLTGGRVARGLLLAEAVRFQSRIAAAMDLFSVDDVLTLDALLDMLGLGPVTCSADPGGLVAALKEECFLRSRRFMLNLPRALGRVRPGSVDDGLLLEHASAWCDARAPKG